MKDKETKDSKVVKPFNALSRVKRKDANRKAVQKFRSVRNK